jgi:hypothetical protein
VLATGASGAGGGALLFGGGGGALRLTGALVSAGGGALGVTIGPGWTEAGWTEAGWTEAGWTEAGCAGAGGGADAGCADAGCADAGGAAASFGSALGGGMMISTTSGDSSGGRDSFTIVRSSSPAMSAAVRRSSEGVGGGAALTRAVAAPGAVTGGASWLPPWVEGAGGAPLSLALARVVDAAERSSGGSGGGAPTLSTGDGRIGSSAGGGAATSVVGTGTTFVVSEKASPVWVFVGLVGREGSLAIESTDIICAAISEDSSDRVVLGVTDTTAADGGSERGGREDGPATTPSRLGKRTSGVSPRQSL